MLITEALEILAPLLENQGSFPIRMKLGEEDLGRVSVVGGISKAWTSPNAGQSERFMYLSPGKDTYTVQEVYDSLSREFYDYGTCPLVGRVKDKDFEIANFTNGLSDVGGGAKYFGGCSIFLLTSE